MESGGIPYKLRWYFWLGIALLVIAGIFLILLIRYFIEAKPDIGSFIFLLIFLVMIPAIPGIYLVKRGSGKPVQKQVKPHIIPVAPSINTVSSEDSKPFEDKVKHLPTGPISKKFYFSSTLAAAILLITGGIVSSLILREIPAGPLGNIIIVFGTFIGSCLSIYIAVIFNIILFKAWKFIGNDHPRTTPWKAIGLLFIPFFNLYWVFQSVRGFIFDYNTYMAQSERQDLYLGSHLFTGFSILFVLVFAMWFVPVPFLNAFLSALVFVILEVYTSLVVGKLCDAINNINKV